MRLWRVLLHTKYYEDKWKLFTAPNFKCSTCKNNFKIIVIVNNMWLKTL